MDAKLRMKRIEILLKIDSISDKCNCANAKEFKDCENCKELAELGNQLNALLSPKREGGIRKDGKYTTPAEKHQRIYTTEMVNFLKENAHLYTYTEMAEKLDLTTKQVQVKCSQFKIKCKTSRTIYNFYENDILIATGYIAQIARKTGIQESSLSKYANGKRKKSNKRLVKVNESNFV